jgi:CheY-like chemotaxis protein
MRILIVEDNVDVAATLADLLDMDGYGDVAIAHDGRSALDKVRASVPDLVLCDIGLPGEIDGLEFARRCRGDKALAAARLIAMSGYGGDQDRARAIAAGFDDLLAKPVRFGTLSELLRTFEGKA